MASVDERYPCTAYIGFAFCLVWLQVVCPVLWGEGLVWAPIIGDPAYSTCVHVVVNVSLALVVIAAAVLERRLHNLFAQPRFLLAGGACSLVGTLAMLGSLALGLPALCFGAACALSGVGMGMLLIRSMMLFGHLAPQRILLLTAASWVLAFGMDLMFRSVSSSVAIPSFCLMPIFATGLLALPIASNREGRTEVPPAPDGPALHPPRSFWQFVFTVFLIALVAETVVYFNSYNEGARLLSMRYTDVAVVVASGLLVAFAAVFPSSYGYTKLYHLIVFGVMILLGLLFVFPHGGSWSLVASLTAYQCFSLLVWCLFSFATYQSRLSALKVFGYGYGLQLLGGVAGYLLGCGLDDVLGTREADFLPVYLVATMIVLAIALVVYPPRAMHDMLLAIPDDDVEEGAREEPVVQDAWTLACEALASKGRLTAREREVMMLLARGRGSLYISEHLGVVLSTVYTHTRNLYRKLGVHSREELMQVIDEKVASE